ncbi:MAG: ABC transporter substrate-binding protein [Betaproteobacteria bacterium]|jgi:NitT/TauT family transport system substrate-binding protein
MKARLLLLALGLWCAAAGAQQKIVFGLVSPLTVVNGQLLVAKHLGYLAEEGIEVETVVFNGSAVLLPQIVAKRVTVGFPNPDPLVISRQPGKDPLPLKYVYNVIRENVWEFAVLANSPVKTLADLKGKKIAVGALAFGNIPLTRAMFKEMGIEVGRDLELVPTGLGAPAFLALKDGRVDALNLFETMHTQLETQGTAVRRLKMPQKYLDLFSNGIIAHEDTIRTNPKLLAAFGRALAKATLACNVNRPGCVKAAWKEDPSLKPPGTNEAKILADSVALLNARYDKYLAFPKGERPRWGEYPEGAWKNMVQVMADGGQIQTTAIDLNSLYTNALVPAMNNFDPAAVIADARKLP